MNSIFLFRYRSLLTTGVLVRSYYLGNICPPRPPPVVVIVIATVRAGREAARRQCVRSGLY